MAADERTLPGAALGRLLEASDLARLVAALDGRRSAALAGGTVATLAPTELALFDTVCALAADAATRAHAPYSQLHVGAVVVDRLGCAFVGCNVENASFGLTLCAERNALGSARVCGSREIALVVVTSSNGSIPPCGACRQVILELAPRALVAACDTSGGALRVWSVSDLLPDAFGCDGLPAG